MRFKPTKKTLKAGEQLAIMGKLCAYNLDSWCYEYGCTPEEGYKLYIETNDVYIDINLNHGYSITNLKVNKIDFEYRCKAIIEKI